MRIGAVIAIAADHAARNAAYLPTVPYQGKTPCPNIVSARGRHSLPRATRPVPGSRDRKRRDALRGS